jgi:hypothetical protein
MRPAGTEEGRLYCGNRHAGQQGDPFSPARIIIYMYFFLSQEGAVFPFNGWPLWTGDCRIHPPSD